MTDRALYLLFTLGGISALVYEVVWMRSFRLVFGSSTRSAAVVLAAYFAGMALGNLLGARFARGARPLRGYGIAELAVGLCALGVAPWLALFRWIYADLHGALGAALPLELAKLALSFAALAPCTMAMGATLPLAAAALVRSADHVARRAGLLYALNTLGASGGALLATFVLPTTLGLLPSVYAAVALNLAIGAAALLLRERPPLAHADTGRPRERPPAGAALAAAVSGFGTLALEVLFVRILSQRSEGSVYTFGLMLVIFLLCLAAGAAIASRSLDRREPWRFLASTQLAAALAILLAPVLFTMIPFLLMFAPEDTLAVRLARFSAGSLIVLGPPVCLIGLVLPATWKVAARSAHGAGPQVGLLTGINTLAGVLGSLCAGFVLLPALGLARSLVGVAALYGALALVASALARRGARRPLLHAGAVGAVFAGWIALGPWRIDFQPLRPGERLLRYSDGEAATVTVTETRGHRVLRLNHAYLLGSSAAAEREVRQGRLPLVLHPAPSKVAFIGVATGMTVSAALDFPVERAVAIELVPGVVDVLPEFGRWSREFYRDPRFEVVVADGRDHLRGTRERFDVVVSDLFVPWHAGTGDLYSEAHFAAVRERLAPGGLFAQWLPAYQLTLEELRSVTATFLRIFPETVLYRSDFDPERPLLALVGYRDRLALDPEALRDRSARLAKARTPPEPVLTSPAGVALLLVAGPEALARWSAGAPLNTDERPYIEYATPRSMYLHRQRDLGDVLRQLPRLGPREWPYPEPPAADRPIERVFGAAALLQDAALAKWESNFEREYVRLLEAARDHGDVAGVAHSVLGAARRYRERSMTARSEALLRALVAHPEPPVAALLALAEHARTDGRDAEAIPLLERALERAPGRRSARRALLELLDEAGEFERAEAHARVLLERRPDDAYLRIDLAHYLDRQGRSEEARAEVARVRELPGALDREALGRHLRRKGLGPYLDRPL